MGNKIVSIVITVVIFFSSVGVIPFTASAKEISVQQSDIMEERDFLFQSFDDGTVKIISYIGNLTEVFIPEYLNEQKVSIIGEKAFRNTNIRSVVIPDSVEIIEDYAFYDCGYLETVVMGDNVKTVGNYAFADCPKIRDFNFGVGVTTIGDSVFNYCDALKSIYIPESVEKIGNIITGFTYYDSKLRKIGVSPYNKYYSSLEGSLYNKNKTELIRFAYNSSDNGEFTVPDSVTKISAFAFYGCLNITSISFPDTINYIGKDAFYNTKWYEQLPTDEDIYIGKCLFKCNSESDDTVNVKEGTETIGTEAFSNVSGALKKVILPDTIKTISEGTFENCKYLESISFPDGLSKIEDYAFKECKSILSVNIPANISLGQGVFENCTKLSSVTIEKETGKYTFKGCKSLNKIVFMDAVTKIDENAFESCCNITDINLPKELNTIEKSAFFSCYNLSNIEFPDTLTWIGDSAFENCVLLEKISIPKKTTLGQNVFKNCLNLSSATIAGEIGPYTFHNCTYLQTVVLEDTVTKIDEYAFQNCTSLTEVILPDSITSVGTGIFGSCHKLKRVVLPNSITKIDGTFNYCENLTDVTLPTALQEIGDGTFLECISLKSITIPASVKKISKEAFANCKKLENINFPNYLEYIGEGAFKSCQSIKSIKIPDSVREIGESCFYECTSLENVKLPSSLKSIDRFAFGECSKLKNIKFPEGIETINGFNNCDSLESVTLPNTVRVISGCAFGGCDKLKSINIPESVEYIGWWAFVDCPKLKSITIPSSSTKLNECSFAYESYVFYDSMGCACDSVRKSKDIKDFVIKGIRNSEAEKYAKQEGIKFVDLNTTVIKLAKSSARVYVKGTASIKATVTNGNGKTTYRSNNAKVAKVNSKGEITALKAGTAKITVTNGEASKVFTVKVLNPKLSKKSLKLKNGKNFTLKITGKIGKVKFSTSNKKVATVNSKGKIVAKKKGNAVITVKSNGVTLNCKVKVY